MTTTDTPETYAPLLQAARENYLTQLRYKHAADAVMARVLAPIAEEIASARELIDNAKKAAAEAEWELANLVERAAKKFTGDAHDSTYYQPMPDLVTVKRRTITDLTAPSSEVLAWVRVNAPVLIKPESFDEKEVIAMIEALPANARPEWFSARVEPALNWNRKNLAVILAEPVAAPAVTAESVKSSDDDDDSLPF